MIDSIIGRKVEQEILHQLVESDNPELITIYGRPVLAKPSLFVNISKTHLASIIQASIKELRKSNLESSNAN